MMQALPTFFSICLKNYKGFTAADATKVFNEIKHFDFDSWNKLGTGSGAEIQASEDLKSELVRAYDDNDGTKGSALRV